MKELAYLFNDLQDRIFSDYYFSDTSDIKMFGMSRKKRRGKKLPHRTGKKR